MYASSLGYLGQATDVIHRTTGPAARTTVNAPPPVTVTPAPVPVPIATSVPTTAMPVTNPQQASSAQLLSLLSQYNWNPSTMGIPANWSVALGDSGGAITCTSANVTPLSGNNITLPQAQAFIAACPPQTAAQMQAAVQAGQSPFGMNSPTGWILVIGAGLIVLLLVANR